MPTIHVSDHTEELIEKEKKGDESPTDTIRRIFTREDDRIERIVRETLQELNGRY